MSATILVDTIFFIITSMKLKKYLLVALLLVASLIPLSAQQHDNVWLMGRSGVVPDSNSVYALSMLNFSQIAPEISFLAEEMDFDATNSSISDAAGNLLFYTNGAYIADASHQPMENGTGLNPGDYVDANGPDGLVIRQGTLILPRPQVSDQYYLFHVYYEYPDGDLSFHGSRLNYSLIDMTENNGLGAVIEKNQTIFADTLDKKISAVKHANGTDWWIVMQEYGSNGFHKLLLNSDSISYQGIQYVGDSIPNGLGGSLFSPDGSRFAAISLFGGLNNDYPVSIYDFNRCNGVFSNPLHFVYGDSAWYGGVAISPSSQFLYICNFNEVFQFDLWAEEIEASQQTVAVYDEYVEEPWPGIPTFPKFNVPQLGPDGKIYISTGGSSRFLHVIHDPDEPGLNCNVEQRAIMLPTFNLRSIPVFPNYRLGPLSETACDSLVSTEPDLSIDNAVSIFPNPASDVLTLRVDYPLKGHWQIFNALGQEVFKQDLIHLQQEYVISVDQWTTGIYYYRVSDDQGRMMTGRVVVE